LIGVERKPAQERILPGKLRAHVFGAIAAAVVYNDQLTPQASPHHIINDPGDMAAQPHFLVVGRYYDRQLGWRTAHIAALIGCGRPSQDRRGISVAAP
jgi:hypothetical protein